MKIDRSLINKLAELSKLEFNEEDAAEIQKNLGNILDLVEKLNEVDTEGVEPLIYMNENVDVFREDKVKQVISKEEGLKNAPDKDSDYIKVPKVISK
jgi:aspartyl-tRNA(Asn)/glutamyl-tRNA(Gln) amidotransferase subunit C